ncbi:DUF2283 domain-containing protein [Candidatus Woesearchaeota archaeon]|nr:DUF2283 domain-containing protein [Candidatus Woesearchaeota archaeon]
MEGEVDYDYKNDILFFKTKNMDYDKSIEMDNIILDIDSEGLIVGIQIFEASKFLRMNKLSLREILHWEFGTKVDKIKEGVKELTKIEIRLTFKVKVRNQLVEKNPIIMPQPTSIDLPTSELFCVA